MLEEERALRDARVVLLGSFYSVAAMDGQTAHHLAEMIVKHASSETGTVMCMGHNRGWEEAASNLSGQNVELKTANAALLQSSRKNLEWPEAFSHVWHLIDVVKPDQ